MPLNDYFTPTGSPTTVNVGTTPSSVAYAQPVQIKALSQPIEVSADGGKSYQSVFPGEPIAFAAGTLTFKSRYETTATATTGATKASQSEAALETRYLSRFADVLTPRGPGLFAPLRDPQLVPTTNGSYTLANQVSRTSPLIRYVGEPAEVQNGSYYRGRLIGGVGSAYENAPLIIEQTVDCRYLEISVSASSANCYERLLVTEDDGVEREAYSGTRASGAATVLKFDFGTKAVRTIRWEAINGMLAGVAVEAYDSVSPSSTAYLPCAGIGDSYMYGNGATRRSLDSWFMALCRAMRHAPVFKGLTSSGHLNPGSANAAQDRSLFSARVAQAATDAQRPGLALLIGSFNDTVTQNASYTPAALESAATTNLLNLKGMRPTPLVISGGPWGPSTAFTSSGALYDANLAVRAAALAAGVPHIEPHGGRIYNELGTLIAEDGPWFVGTGKVGAPVGSGNTNVYIGGYDGNDSIHPNTAGYRYLATRFLRAFAVLRADMLARA